MSYLGCESELDGNLLSPCTRKKKLAKLKQNVIWAQRGRRGGREKHFVRVKEKIKKMLTVLKSFVSTCALESPKRAQTQCRVTWCCWILRDAQNSERLWRRESTCSSPHSKDTVREHTALAWPAALRPRSMDSNPRTPSWSQYLNMWSFRFVLLWWRQDVNITINRTFKRQIPQSSSD